MKDLRLNHHIRFGILHPVLCAILTMGSVGIASAQETPEVSKDVHPVKNTFESIWLSDHQTVMVPITGTFEMDFQHRFGIWNNGYDDFYGIFAPSNMRIGFNYVPVNDLLIGFGLTKQDLIWDAHVKYAVFKQGRSGGWPVSISYYANVALDTREEAKSNFSEGTDRWSFFHQAMIARKVTDKFSLQADANLSWFNYKDQQYDPEGAPLGRDKNAHLAAGVLGRYKLTTTMGLIAGYEFPLSDHQFIEPEPNLTIGLEMVSSSHAFQFFVGNYKSLSPQYNATFNENNFGDSEILIGFNITRLWNF